MADAMTQRLSYGALAAALVLVVVLARQQQTLRARYDDLNRRFQTPHAGMFVPTFRAATIGGDSVTIGRVGGGGRQLLLFLTTTCSYCIQSLASWRELATRCDSVSGVDVYAVSLDSVPETQLYLQRHGLSVAAAFFPERKLAILYRVRNVPVTMVVDSVGRVLYARRGVFEGRAARDSVLGVLPGCSPEIE
jgi:peroxiredoxin